MHYSFDLVLSLICKLYFLLKTLYTLRNTYRISWQYWSSICYFNVPYSLQMKFIHFKENTGNPLSVPSIIFICSSASIGNMHFLFENFEIARFLRIVGFTFHEISYINVWPQIVQPNRHTIFNNITWPTPYNICNDKSTNIVFSPFINNHNSTPT